MCTNLEPLWKLDTVVAW